MAKLLALLLMLQSSHWLPQQIPLPRQTVSPQNTASWLLDSPLPESRRGLPIGDILDFIGEAIGGLFKFIGAILKGIFELVIAIVKGVGELLVAIVRAIVDGGTAIVQSVKVLIHGARVGEHAKPQQIDTAAHSLPGSGNIQPETAPTSPKMALDSSPGADTRYRDMEALGRLTSDARVKEEMEEINKKCGKRAATLTAANHAILKECLVQIREVRQACTQSGSAKDKSNRNCKRQAEKSDDNCSVSDSTQFFIEFSAACHAYAVARR